MGVDRAGRRVVRRHDDPAEGVALDARRIGAVLDARGRDRARVEGRHGQDALSHVRRPSGRGRAHALPRRTPFAVSLVAVRLPAHVHVLRDRCDAVRAEPHGVGDPRPGAPLPAEGASEPRRVHGHGRAVPELRRGARVGAAPSRPRDHAPPHDDLDRRLDARTDPVRRRGRPADPARALAPRRRSSEALRAHARERPLSARRRTRRVPPLRRAASPEGVRRVRHAGGRERLSGGCARARGRARRAVLQGQPHPVQPDRALRRLVARDDRAVQGSARAGADSRRRCGSRAAATSKLPAASWPRCADGARDGHRRGLLPRSRPAGAGRVVRGAPRGSAARRRDVRDLSREPQRRLVDVPRGHRLLAGGEAGDGQLHGRRPRRDARAAACCRRRGRREDRGAGRHRPLRLGGRPGRAIASSSGSQRHATVSRSRSRRRRRPVHSGSRGPAALQRCSTTPGAAGGSPLPRQCCRTRAR